MTLIKTSWYLCIMLFLSSIVLYLGSHVPSPEQTLDTMVVLDLILSLLSGIAAIILRRLHNKKPDLKIFNSKVIDRAYIALAVIITWFFVVPIIA